MVVIERMMTILDEEKRGSGRDKENEDHFGGEKEGKWSS